jgi:NADPH-dependent glutamate synthase beta subunit-like oxidoreductase
MDALRFLEYAIYRPNLVHGFSKIIVIGGGNTALDTAVTAKQLGAKQVTVLYRRDLAQLPAWPREIHEALFLKHITLIPLCQPIRITPTENISIKKIECVSTALGNPDSSGRPFPIPIEGSNFELEADLIISAIGQVPNQSFELDLMEAGGRFKVDKDGRTSMPNVFAAGDFVTGSKTVVEAVAAGKRTANVIALQLTESPKNV